MTNNHENESEVELKPDFDRLFATFSREAKIQAERVEGALAPYGDYSIGVLVEVTERRKRDTILQALNSVRNVLVPLNICAQSMTNAKSVAEYRTLIAGITEEFVKRTDELTAEHHAEEIDDERPNDLLEPEYFDKRDATQDDQDNDATCGLCRKEIYAGTFMVESNDHNLFHARCWDGGKAL